MSGPRPALWSIRYAIGEERCDRQPCREPSVLQALRRRSPPRQRKALSIRCAAHQHLAAVFPRPTGGLLGTRRVERDARPSARCARPIARPYVERAGAEHGLPLAGTPRCPWSSSPALEGPRRAPLPELATASYQGRRRSEMPNLLRPRSSPTRAGEDTRQGPRGRPRRTMGATRSRRPGCRARGRREGGAPMRPALWEPGQHPHAHEHCRERDAGRVQALGDQQANAH